METFLSIGLNNVVNRFNEVKLILDLAKEEHTRQDRYNSLCRSAHILLVAHFEGALKDVIISIIDDINKYGSFSTTPDIIKRTFCEYFIPTIDSNSKSKEKSVLKLLNTLNSLDTKLLKEAFLFKENKNPSAKIIDTFASRFGIKYFFKFIDNSVLDAVFEGSFRDIKQLQKTIYNQLLSSVETYPYSIDYSNYNFNTSVIDKKTKTIWETFLEELLKHRHSIAHGTEIGNILSHHELEETVFKVEIITYAFAVIIAYNSNPACCNNNQGVVV